MRWLSRQAGAGGFPAPSARRRGAGRAPALKLARAYHLARGEASRTVVIGRVSSYHGNTLGALDAGGKRALRAPPEPVGGATLAAAVPTDDYWPAVVEICRGHGVLVIADEVMTGFGRTGRWFGLDHWGVRPDVLTAGKGSTSGYWPFGFAACPGGGV